MWQTVFSCMKEQAPSISTTNTSRTTLQNKDSGTAEPAGNESAQALAAVNDVCSNKFAYTVSAMPSLVCNSCRLLPRLQLSICGAAV